MELGSKLSRITAALFVVVVCVATSVHAGIGGLGRRGVGGVMIDGKGVVRAATVAEKQELANLVREMTAPAEGDLAEATEMRMISLKGLQSAVIEAKQTGSLPDEVEYLAGLQRIEYVFVDKENQDIVIAGPAEPWVMTPDGAVVGKITGGSTMRLADLLVAFRSVETARNGGISCSIEPTEEGRTRLRKLLSGVTLRPGQNPKGLENAMKQAFGPQMIHLNGIPGDSRYARTLVAADFEMKRVAMELIPSPVAGLPSYLSLSKNSRHAGGQNPRWWMACDYDSLAKSEDGLTWKLSGQGVKTMTEQDIIQADGSVQRGGKVDKVAQQWADKMTDTFQELSREMPVFADLQNIMDMTVVATLITQEHLAQKAGFDMGVLATDNDTVQLASYPVPQSVAPQCSFVRGRAGWVVTASGGVDINAFGVVEDQTTDASVAQSRTALASAGDRWWWNK